MMDRQFALDQALLSLEGLSVGDAVGEQILRRFPAFTWDAVIPRGPLPWTDDTHMALSVVEILSQQGEIDQDQLALRFAQRFTADPERGYSAATWKFLEQIGQGGDWRELSRARFASGSYGNGAAMRVAPLGGYFVGDPAQAAQQAVLSAEITHAHPEGLAGAIAVAVAASLAGSDQTRTGVDFLQDVLAFTPDGEVAQGIQRALEIPAKRIIEAVKVLGTGYKISAQDTVPFCLWVAAHHGTDYEKALRVTMQGMGDCDTTCAIVGGIVSLKLGQVPGDLLGVREPLPDLR